MAGADAPFPRRGIFSIYGYLNEVLLPVQIQVPANLARGQAVTLRAHASWLVCKDVCVPGKEDLRSPCRWSRPATRRTAPFSSKRRRAIPEEGTPPFTAAWTARARSCC